MAVFERVTQRGTGRTLFVYSVPMPSRGRGEPGTPAQAVYDGDTVRTIFPGSQGLRFLGCDSPELAYRVPVSPNAFKANQKIEGPLWSAYLDDPLAPGSWPSFPAPGLHPLLEAHLRARTGPGCAANHAHYGELARQALIDLLEHDKAELGISDEDFRLFAIFAHEVLDSYGRPLVFANVDVKEQERRPALTYNERVVAQGAASPLFIWPNVDPFRRQSSVTDAAFPPRRLRELARTGKLGASRRAAGQARAQHIGIYDADDPLRLEAFELRLLGDRKRPSRWVIDLAADDDDPTLYPPDGYPLVPHAEDRLFIPEEYVPLFIQHGWRAGILVMR